MDISTLLIVILFCSLTICIGVVVVGVWYHHEKKRAGKKLEEFRDAISGGKQ